MLHTYTVIEGFSALEMHLFLVAAAAVVVVVVAAAAAAAAVVVIVVVAVVLVAVVLPLEACGYIRTDEPLPDNVSDV